MKVSKFENTKKTRKKMKTSYNITDYENAFKDISIPTCIEFVNKGHFLGIFLNHKDWLVRVVVAIQGYGLDKLINDESFYVRAEVAIKGYGLDKLINDKHWLVRSEVANQGYGLDKLIKDKHSYVREVAQEKLKEQEQKKNEK